MSYGHAKLYVGFYLTGMERAVEGPELDSAYTPPRPLIVLSVGKAARRAIVYRE